MMMTEAQLIAMANSSSPRSTARYSNKNRTKVITVPRVKTADSAAQTPAPAIASPSNPEPQGQDSTLSITSNDQPVDNSTDQHVSKNTLKNQRQCGSSSMKSMYSKGTNLHHPEFDPVTGWPFPTRSIMPRDFPNISAAAVAATDIPTPSQAFQQPEETTSTKKNKKKKKKGKKEGSASDLTSDPFYHQELPYPSGAGVNNYSTPHVTSRSNGDDLWNNKPADERERIKEFWLSLEEDERKSLVRLEKETVLKKMREQQKTTCTCNICGRKRNAIERELEGLYDSYYQELEQFAQEGNVTPFLSDPQTLGLKRQPVTGVFTQPQRGSRIVEHVSEDTERYVDEDSEDEGEDDDERLECSEDENHQDDCPPQSGYTYHHSVYRGLGRGDEAPYDDPEHPDVMRHGDSTRFIEMMEKLAERRLRRSPTEGYSVDDLHYSQSINSHYRHGHGHVAHSHSHDHDHDHHTRHDHHDHDHHNRHDHHDHHNHSHDYQHHHELDHDHDHDHEYIHDPAHEHDEFNDDHTELMDDDEEDDDYGEGMPDDGTEQEDIQDDAQRMAEGRRMFQIFAARMFEQRVLAAYRKKLAAERSARLMQELEAEERAKEEREAARASKQQRKREKERLKKQAIAEAKEQKQREKELVEAQLKDQKAEQNRRKAEEKRLAKEAQRKAKEEERRRKEEERLRRLAEQEKKNKEVKERERKAREEKEQQEKAEKEAREAKERGAQEKEAKAAEAAATEKERQRQEVEASETAHRQEELAKAVATPVTPDKPKATVLVSTLAVQTPVSEQTTVSGALHEVLSYGPNPTVRNSPKAATVTPVMSAAKISAQSRARIPSQQIGDNASSTAPSGSQASGGPSQNTSPLVGSSIHTSPSPVSVAHHNLGSVPPALPVMHQYTAHEMSPSTSTGPKHMMQQPIELFMSRAPPGLSAVSMPPTGFSSPARPMNEPYQRFGSVDGVYMPPGLGMSMKNFPGPPPGLNQGFDAFGGLPVNGSFGVAPNLPHDPIQSAFQSPNHGRQMSGSYDMSSLGMNSAPKPAPIGRPGSISAASSQMNARVNNSASDDVREHLGSRALLDDTQDDIIGPISLPQQRAGSGVIGSLPSSQAPASMMRSSFSSSPFVDSKSPFSMNYNQWAPTPLVNNNSFAPPAGIWNSPALTASPFGSININNSHGVVGTPGSHSTMPANPMMSSLGTLNRRRSVPPPMLRKTLVAACVKCQEDVSSTVVNGYMEYSKVKRQVDIMTGYEVDPEEVMVVTETLGNRMNGGGTFDCKENNGLLLIRWEPPPEYVIQKFGQANGGNMGPNVNGRDMQNMNSLDDVSVIGQGIERV